MSIEDLQMLFQFIGGLGMFLYGLDIMGDGLQKSLGHKMQQLLGALTGSGALGVLLGTGITAIIQSSSATTVMVVGFVNAGIINLQQAVGIIMGANIGTTVTSWIVSMNDWAEMLKPDLFAPVLVGIGAFFNIFSKNGKRKQAGEVILGFGMLFIGLGLMSESVVPYHNSTTFKGVVSFMGNHPFAGILTGLAVTGMIRSSSASVGILQTLALNEMVNWKSAVFIILGQNIGSCVSALRSSVGTNRTAKQAAVIHLLFNVTGAVLFGIIMYTVFQRKEYLGASLISSVEISIFHTVFNVGNTILLFPFSSMLVKVSGLITRKKQEKPESKTKKEEWKGHLDERILETPSFAIENVTHEIVHMGYAVLENFDIASETLMKYTKEAALQVMEIEEEIDDFEEILTGYLIKLSNQSLSQEQHLQVKNLFYIVSDLERVSDHCENLSELAIEKAERGIVFSKEAEEGLREMLQMVRSSLEHAIIARQTADMSDVRAVVRSEERVDNLEEELRERHIERLSDKTCKPENGVIFLDALNNLERVSDHAHNIAGYVREEM